jgi:hypothetical protein
MLRRRSDRQSVLVSRTHLGLKTRFLFLSDSCRSFLSLFLFSESESDITTDCRSASLGIKHPSGAYDQIFIAVRQLRVCWCGPLFDKRTGLSFTISSVPRQRSHFWVWVPWDSWQYFTVSDSRLLFSSPPTTRGVAVEVFDPASTLEYFLLLLFESESYITTDSQSASLSWNKAPVWLLRPDFYYCQTIAGLSMWGDLSDERTGLSFTFAAGLARAVIFGSESRRTRDHTLMSQIRDFPFRRLLRFAGLRWRYSTPPPHGRPFSAPYSRLASFRNVLRTVQESPSQKVLILVSVANVLWKVVAMVMPPTVPRAFLVKRRLTVDCPGFYLGSVYLSVA